MIMLYSRHLCDKMIEYNYSARETVQKLFVTRIYKCFTTEKIADGHLDKSFSCVIKIMEDKYTHTVGEHICQTIISDMFLGKSYERFR